VSIVEDFRYPLELNFAQWILDHGPIALFFLLIFGIVGLPVPDEVLLVTCGFFIHDGKLGLLGIWLGGALGSMCGITFSYLIGRTVGLGLLHSRLGKLMHVRDKHIEKVHKFFDRIGRWALFVGYYIPGVRHFTALVAGTSRLEYRSFALFAYAGACVWVTSFISLGYWLASRFNPADRERIFEVIHRNLTIIAIVGGALLVPILLPRWWLKRQAKRRRQIGPE
jgi:membrane protein DedA with SNARE-associated domain